MTTALSYSFIKDPSGQGRVYGLEVAIAQWVRAFFRYGKQETFPVLIDNAAAQDEILAFAAEAGLDPKRLALLDARRARENLGAGAVVFRADCSSNDLFWQRELLPANGFAFCGLTHSVAGLETGRMLEQYCLAPSAPGDALVCTSRAVKAAVMSFWETYAAYLAQRFGARFSCPVDLPIIPLGVNFARIAELATPEARAAQRAALGIGEEEIAVLWVGRLSMPLKAHPLPMFRAVEEAARRTGKRVRFVMNGYFMPPEHEAAYRAMAAEVCHTAEVLFLSNSDPRFPETPWALGDIFLSLVDNPQESFGLTPIEAIAAGLPRVLSDWDGYRDSATDGVDGFLIPTIQPPPGQGGELAAQLLTGRELYGGFLAKTAQSVAVDHEAAAEALVKLIENPALRRQMAEAAAARLPGYDWKNIIPAYESLWAEQTARRAAFLAQNPRRPWPALPPQAPDPFTQYAAYPTRALTAGDKLALAASESEIRALLSQPLNIYGLDVLIAPERLMALLNGLAERGPTTVAALLQSHADAKPALWRSLTWLLKLGILRLQG